MRSKIFKFLAIFLTLFTPFFPIHAANLNSADFEVASQKQARYILNDLGITGGAVTIAFWAKLESNPDAGSTRDMVDSMDGGTMTHYFFEVREASGNYNVTFRRGRNWTNGTSVTATAFNPGTTNWHHYVGSYDGTNIALYIDGSLVAGPSAASGNGGTSGNDHFMIGAIDGAEGSSIGSNTQARHMDGLIDDVMVFNSAVGWASTTNYNTPCTPNTTGAVARYELDNSWDDTVGSFHLNDGEGSPNASSTDVAYTCATPGGQPKVPDIIIFSFKHEEIFNLELA